MTDQSQEYDAHFKPEDGALVLEIPAGEGAKGVQWIAYCKTGQRAITFWSSDLHRVNTAAIHHSNGSPGHVVQIYQRNV